MKKKLILIFQFFFFIKVLFFNTNVLADVKISSNRYLISGQYIKHVQLNTNKDNFVKDFDYKNATLDLLCDNEKSYVGTQCLLKLKDLTMIEREYSIIVNGDVTGDGDSTITDIVKIALHSSEKNKFTNEALVLASDVNGDDFVSNDDVKKLSYYNIVSDDNIIFNDKTVAKNFELETKSLVLSKGSSSEIKIKENNSDVSIISWESSNENVVTVDTKGIVTAVGPGEAIITIKSKDGESVSLEVSVIVVVPDTGVSLTKFEEMEINSTKKLNATISPSDCTNKKITWSSSNNDIATVSSDGVVKALKSGEVTITATTITGNTDSIKIKVIVPATKISLDETIVKLLEGKTTTLNATISPDDVTNKNIIWASDNEKVAVIDNTGKITAIKKGEATITATSGDGRQKATCKIVVDELKLSISDSKLNLVSISSKQLKTSLSVDYIDDSVIWSSSNTNVVTVDNSGKVTAKKEGTAIITAKLNYDTNITISSEVIVSTAKFLFVGNSKTYYPETVDAKLGIPKRLKNIASSEGYEIECYYAVVPSVGLGVIINESDDRNKVSVIKNNYDYVVLNEGTTAVYKNYTNYYNNINKIKKWVEEKNANVSIYVRKIWIRIKRDQNGYPEEGSTLDQIETSYKNANKLASELGVNTINDGALFYDTLDNYSNIHIMKYQDGDKDDLVHQNATGAYLAALCFYAEIFDEDPTEVTYNAGISTSVANTLKNQAKKHCYKN